MLFGRVFFLFFSGNCAFVKENKTFFKTIWIKRIGYKFLEKSLSADEGEKILRVIIKMVERVDGYNELFTGNGGSY